MSLTGTRDGTKISMVMRRSRVVQPSDKQDMSLTKAGQSNGAEPVFPRQEKAGEESEDLLVIYDVGCSTVRT